MTRVVATGGHGNASSPVNVEALEGIEEAPRLRAGSNRCQCARCGRFFGSVTAFDKHHRRIRDGNVQCLSDNEMWGSGMVQGATGWWYATAATWGPKETNCNGADQ